MADRWNLGFVIGILCISTVEATDSSDTSSACNKWASISKDLSGNGRLQVCQNNKTKECTRFDCEGSLKIPERDIGGVVIDSMTFDYCYGCQLNSCSDPTSMDFYLKVPSNNFTFQENVKHNEMKSISGLKIPLGSFGEASPIFFFTMEKKDGFVSFSVKLKVHMLVLGRDVYFPQLEKTLIDEASIPSKTCHGGGTPSEPFEPGPCHAMKYPVAPPSPSPVVTTIKPQPSNTLNKSCDLVKQPCSPREICDPQSSLCKCGPDFHLSPANDACLAYSKVGQPCRSKADCGFNEMCAASDKGSSKCQCKKGYEYMADRLMCIVPHPHGKALEFSTKHPIPTQPTPKPAETSSSKAAFPKYLVIGVSVGAFVLLFLVFIGFVCYKRRRNVIRVNLNDYGGAQPLLSSNGDDDTNIIM